MGVDLSLLVAKFFGNGAYAVVSGSMEPTYHVGSLIYVKKVNPDELKIGDPITFAITDEIVVTHRIVEINQTQDGLEFTTKGDANDSKDANPVNYRNVIGKPIISIPYLGYVFTYMQKPPGLYITLAVVGL